MYYRSRYTDKIVDEQWVTDYLEVYAHESTPHLKEWLMTYVLEELPDQTSVYSAKDSSAGAPDVPYPEATTAIPYGYTMWGGQLRDNLPHGRRWYMNGGRW